LGVIEGNFDVILRDRIVERTDPIRLVEALPVTVSYTRGSRCRAWLESEYFRCSDQQKGECTGFRLHATVTVDQLIDEWVLALLRFQTTSFDELVLDQRDFLVLIGDKFTNRHGRERTALCKLGTVFLSGFSYVPQRVNKERLTHDVSSRFRVVVNFVTDQHQSR